MVSIYFEVLCIVHILVWLFIIFAFVNKQAAEFNLYYLIPLIYILHLLPFHIIVSLKEMVEPENTSEKVNEFEHNNFFASCRFKLIDIFKDATFNPLTPQGMMILGTITSAWALKLDKFIF